MFIPYDNLLTNGRVVRERAVRVVPGRVTLASGAEIEADFLVLASGSSYPFPARTDLHHLADAQAQYRAAHRELSDSNRVLLLGAGPVGLELAGEILAEWPAKQVTIVDPRPDILTAYPAALRKEVRRQLEHELFARLVLGSRLVEAPTTAPGLSRTATVRTVAGDELTADIWYRCYGATPTTDYLAGSLAVARSANGQVRVRPTLQVEGHANVFAVGDVTDVAESKRAGAALRHASVIAANVKALLSGESELTTYQPGPPGILLTLGPRGGAGWSPEHGIVGPEVTSRQKGADMMVGRFNELLGHQAMLEIP
jgi:apoptosis-inducing factor 2